MDFGEYVSRFLAFGHLAEVREAARLVEGDDDYPLLAVRTPGRRTLLITAGFHGDEKAGPLTLLEHLPEIVDHARSRDVGLVIYPCINPSGFVDNTRYNRSGESPNNDFMRYELQPGVLGDTARVGQPITRFYLHHGGPKETRAVCTEIARLPPPDAALDIHQDPWFESEVAYAYTFGPAAPFLPLVDRTERVLPIARGLEVDDDLFSDEHGLVAYHDGSITDWMFRLGVPYTAALETTTRTPMPACHRVNLIWIRGFIDLAAERAR